MHAGEVVVFLGPSLERETARAILDADYRPPAARGDIFRAVREGARIIVLIDGVFFQECAVAHRELLFALSNGVRVIGASSMGALRASELDTLGMEGVGLVYERYKRGELVSDDEVALLFDPDTFQPRSEPLVNIRYNLDHAAANGIIDHVMKDDLIAIARSMYYPERDFESLIARAEAELNADFTRLRAFLQSERRDVKREDAIEALKMIGEEVDT
jgi:hypothetical protein